MQSNRLLYLGTAFPPGVSALFPELQPAGHLIETNLVTHLRPGFDIRSVGHSGVNLAALPHPLPASPGLANELNLLVRPPTLINQMHSTWRLHRAVRKWSRQGWRPDLILVCNFAPIYNAFIRRLARKQDRPRLVLYLADSTLMGVSMSPLKRWRYRLKPFKWLDDEMAGLFDACVAVSADTEASFRARRIPWHWLPNGIDPSRLRSPAAGPEAGPVVFGYFGHAGEHTGIPQLLKLFAASPRTSHLKVCCFGKARTQLANQYRTVSNVSFHGPFDPEGCIAFGVSCDVLVNPRPSLLSNRNNFPSKLFEYGLTGRAILTSRLSGADKILGPHAYYFDAQNFDASLAEMLQVMAATHRSELRRRGRDLQRHLLAEHRWETQAERLITFLRNVPTPAQVNPL